MEYRHEIKHLITHADAIAIRNNLSAEAAHPYQKSTWIQFGIFVLVLLAAIVVVWRLRKHND